MSEMERQPKPRRGIQAGTEVVAAPEAANPAPPSEPARGLDGGGTEEMVGGVSTDTGELVAEPVDETPDQGQAEEALAQDVVGGEQEAEALPAVAAPAPAAQKKSSAERMRFRRNAHRR